MSALRSSLRIGAAFMLAMATGLPLALSDRAGAQSPASAASPPMSFAPVAQAAKAAVVAIRVPRRLAPTSSPELAEEGLGDEDTEAEPLGDLLTRLLDAHSGQAIGAGVVVSASGITLTSARVVKLIGDFDVVTADGTAVKAEVVGIDERTDLAVLRLDPARRPFAHAPLGNSDKVVVGEWVIAIGAPYGLEATVTAGIVSGPARPLGSGPHAELLQTDAAMGPGNAGGPVVNLKGEVVGIVTDLAGAGIGFAVPSNTARKVVADVSEWGRVRRAWLGATLQPLTADLARGLRRGDSRGVLIADVEPGGPAAAAGLRSGDILLHFDARSLGGRFELDRALAGAAPGQTARLEFWRAGRTAAALVVLGEEPGPPRMTPGLGLTIRPLEPGLGVIVVDVAPRSPAVSAGVHRGDVIREIDQQAVKSVEDFERLTRGRGRERPLVLLLRRGVTALYVALTPSR